MIDQRKFFVGSAFLVGLAWLIPGIIFIPSEMTSGIVCILSGVMWLAVAARLAWVNPVSEIIPQRPQPLVILITARRQNPPEPCSICLEEKTSNETLAMLPCTHSFHVACIAPWQRLHSTCPICRA